MQWPANLFKDIDNLRNATPTSIDSNNTIVLLHCKYKSLYDYLDQRLVTGIKTCLQLYYINTENESEKLIDSAQKNSEFGACVYLLSLIMTPESFCRYLDANNGVLLKKIYVATNEKLTDSSYKQLIEALLEYLWSFEACDWKPARNIYVMQNSTRTMLAHQQILKENIFNQKAINNIKTIYCDYVAEYYEATKDKLNVTDNCITTKKEFNEIIETYSMINIHCINFIENIKKLEEELKTEGANIDELSAKLKLIVSTF